MFKGIIALFSSGEILNPMILLGLGFGFFAAFTMPFAKIIQLFSSYHIYVLIIVIAIIYNAAFRRVYKKSLSLIDYKEMTGNIILSAVKLFLASTLSVSFVYLFSIF